MRGIDLIIISLLSIIYAHSQDKFPEHFKVNEFCYLWESDDIETSRNLHKYTKKSDYIIKQELLFEGHVLNADFQLEDMLDLYFQLTTSVRLMTYCEEFNFLFERAFFLRYMQVVATYCATYQHKDDIYWGYYAVRAHWNQSFPKNLYDKWNVQWRLNDNSWNIFSIDELGKRDHYKYRHSKIQFNLDLIYENALKYMFYKTVIAKEKLESPYTGLKERYDIHSKNSGDEKLIESIRNVSDFIKGLDGVWSYCIIEKNEVYDYDFVDIYGASATGLPRKLFDKDKYIFPEQFEERLLKFFGEKKVTYLYPMQFIFYDADVSAVVLLKYYEFVTDSPEDIKLNITGHSYHTGSIENFSKGEIIFKGFGGADIKWEVSADNLEIKEYIKRGNADWSLYAVFRKK